MLLRPLLRSPLQPLLRSPVARSLGWVPLSLFTAGEQGAWYDPSDLSSMYQDSAGTIPAVVGQPVGKILDKSGRGNHATQATSASRPTLSARYNLLTKTEQFDDAAWLKADATITANAAIAPDGAITADKLIANALSTAHEVIQTPVMAVSTAHVFGAALKASEFTWAELFVVDKAGIGSAAYFNLATGAVGSFAAPITGVSIEAIGSGWYRCEVTFNSGSGASTADVRIGPATGDGGRGLVGNNVDGIYVWGADLRTAADAALAIPPYQRVNTATDYDTVGFPHGEKFDGADDFMSSASGGGATQEFFYCAAIKVLGGAGTNRALWSDTGTNSGRKVRINASNELELAVGGGTALAPPVANAPTTATTGGTLAAATYYYVLTALNAKGESLKSNEVSVVTTGTTSANTITWAAVTDATSYRVYRGTAAGGEDVYYAPGNVTSFTDTGAASTAGGPPTTTETAYTTVAVGALPVGETHIVTAWDDGVNLNAQIDQGAVASVARPVVAAGTTGFTEGKDNGAASSFLGGVLFPRVYRQIAPDAAQRAAVQRYCASKAGKTL